MYGLRILSRMKRNGCEWTLRIERTKHALDAMARWLLSFQLKEHFFLRFAAPSIILFVAWVSVFAVIFIRSFHSIQRHFTLRVQICDAFRYFIADLTSDPVLIFKTWQGYVMHMRFGIHFIFLYLSLSPFKLHPKVPARWQKCMFVL